MVPLLAASIVLFAFGAAFAVAGLTDLHMYLERLTHVRHGRRFMITSLMLPVALAYFGVVAFGLFAILNFTS